MDNIKEAATRRTDATRQAIKAARESRGITQLELGRMIGQSRFSIIKLEVGRRPVYLVELCQIATVLGVDVMELLRPEVQS